MTRLREDVEAGFAGFEEQSVGLVLVRSQHGEHLAADLVDALASPLDRKRCCGQR